MKDLLSQLENEAFELKDPWRATNRSLTIIVPIISKVPGSREYVVLDEVKDKVKITDTGRIDNAKIEGNVDQPTFIRGGTMLKGTTQERASQFGIVVIPQKSEQIPIHCIHASRGIRPGAFFATNGFVPREVHSTMLHARSQSSTWQAASNYAMRTEHLVPSGLEVPHDDLVGVVESVHRFREDLNEILKQIPDYVNQVGTVIMDTDGVLDLEMYDHPDSWKAFSQAVHRSFAEAIAKEDKLGIFKPDMEAVIPVIQKFIMEIGKAQEEEVFNKNDARTVILKAEGYVGEFTSLKGKTIHLLVTRSEKETVRNDMSRLPRITGIPSRTPMSTPRRSTPMYTYYTSNMLSLVPPKRWRKQKNVLNALDSPKTWSELRSEISMSKATLSGDLKELQRIGAVDKSGSEYARTGIGYELLKQKDKIRD